MPEKETNKTTANQNKAEPTKVETTTEKLKEEVIEVEKKVEAFEEKADEEVEVLVKKIGFADKIINAGWVKEILNLSFIESSNKWVREHLKTFCKVFGWLGMIGGVLFTIYSIIMFFVGIFDLFRGSAGMFFLSLIFLVLSALILIVSRGWLKMKKWLPALAIICVLIDIIVLIVAIFSAKINFGLYIVSVLISMIVTLYILKNKDLFKN